MRIVNLLAVSLVAALAVVPAAGSAQRISISFGARLGPAIELTAYSQERMGDWHNSYRRWTPVTLYDINGRYYRNRVGGARPVIVYTYDHEYFLPPRDQGWRGVDRRYDYRRQPTDADYGRAQQYSPSVRFDVQLGNEVGVIAYSPDRAGDWRTNARRWTPVTLYTVNGRYFPNNAAGARPVAMYRYKNEYFLPPTDQAWIGSDRRYDYNHQPTKDDHDRARHLDRDNGRTP